MKVFIPFVHEFLLPSFVYAMTFVRLAGPVVQRSYSKIIVASFAFFIFALCFEAFFDFSRHEGYLTSLGMGISWSVCLVGLLVVDYRKNRTSREEYTGSSLSQGCFAAAVASLVSRRRFCEILIMVAWLIDIVVMAVLFGAFSSGARVAASAALMPFRLAVLLCLSAYFYKRFFARNAPDEPGTLLVSCLLLLFACYAFQMNAFITASAVYTLAAILLVPLGIAFAFAGHAVFCRLLRASALGVSLVGIADLLVSLRDSGSQFRLESFAELQPLLWNILVACAVFFLWLQKQAGTEPAEGRKPVRIAAGFGTALICAAWAVWLVFPGALAEVAARNARPETLAWLLRNKGDEYISRRCLLEKGDYGLLRTEAASGRPMPVLESGLGEGPSGYGYLLRVGYEPRYKALLLLGALMEKSSDGNGMRSLGNDEAFICRTSVGYSFIDHTRQMACEALEMAFVRKDMPNAAALAETLRERPGSVDLGFLMMYDEMSPIGEPFRPNETTWQRLAFFREAGFTVDRKLQMEKIASASLREGDALPVIQALLRAGLAPEDFIREDPADRGAAMYVFTDSVPRQHILFSIMPFRKEERAQALALFLENGLDPETVNSHGDRLLDEFVREGGPGIRMLLDAGADPLKEGRPERLTPYEAALFANDRGERLKQFLSWALEDSWPVTEKQKAEAREKLRARGLDTVPGSGGDPLDELRLKGEYYKEHMGMFSALGYTAE